MVLLVMSKLFDCTAVSTISKFLLCFLKFKETKYKPRWIPLGLRLKMHKLGNELFPLLLFEGNYETEALPVTFLLLLLGSPITLGFFFLIWTVGGPEIINPLAMQSVSSLFSMAWWKKCVAFQHWATRRLGNKSEVSLVLYNRRWTKVWNTAELFLRGGEQCSEWYNSASGREDLGLRASLVCNPGFFLVSMSSLRFWLLGATCSISSLHVPNVIT